MQAESSAGSTTKAPMATGGVSQQANELKRKSPDHSPSHEGYSSAASGPPAKQLKSHSHTQSPDNHQSHHHQPQTTPSHQHLQINYLARQYGDDLPLVSNDDSLPSILNLLAEYHSVLERHESLAGNLGARPVGPILIRRFERLFDGPPKVLKSQSKDAHVTWLDVVEFARAKPDQFNLGQMSDGAPVCQFYTKQCRVQISEEDFSLINSGIPQKMIPPQPIFEDEEKELGTLEILEKAISQISNLADSVAARARQLNHRMKGRKKAILDRRATDTPPMMRPSSPSNVALMNGAGQPAAGSALPNVTQQTTSQSGATANFVAVNSRYLGENGRHEYSKSGASPATHSDLRSKFFSLSDRAGYGSAFANGSSLRRPPSVTTPTTQVPSQSTPSTVATASRSTKNGPILNTAQSPFGDAEHAPPVQLPSTSPLSHHHSAISQPSYSPVGTSGGSAAGTAAGSNQPTTAGNGGGSRLSQPERDDGGPFKTEMVARMEALPKGERVMPPCDRCRRLHMDCLKNLTACMGCTRKHAKCSWREVREEELDQGSPSHATRPTLTSDHDSGRSIGSSQHGHDKNSPTSASQAPSSAPLRDQHARTSPPSAPGQPQRTLPALAHPDRYLAPLEPPHNSASSAPPRSPYDYKIYPNDPYKSPAEKEAESASHRFDHDPNRHAPPSRSQGNSPPSLYRAGGGSGFNPPLGPGQSHQASTMSPGRIEQILLERTSRLHNSPLPTPAVLSAPMPNHKSEDSPPILGGQLSRPASAAPNERIASGKSTREERSMDRKPGIEGLMA